jgi:hypothetical protein
MTLSPPCGGSTIGFTLVSNPHEFGTPAASARRSVETFSGLENLLGAEGGRLLRGGTRSVREDLARLGRDLDLALNPVRSPAPSRWGCASA